MKDHEHTKPAPYSTRFYGGCDICMRELDKVKAIMKFLDLPYCGCSGAVEVCDALISMKEEKLQELISKIRNKAFW